MKISIQSAVCWLVLQLAVLLPIGATEATIPSMQRPQVIELSKGWNAVFLEVEPLDVAPGRVFESLPVDMVAGYFPQEASTQFVTNPGTQLFKGQGWGVWYAENRPDAFLKTLNSIYGQQAYLIHATQACSWKLEGLVSQGKVRWTADAYTLTGFSVKAQGAPSFAEFFSASPAHLRQPIYRLVNDVWRKVTNPAAEVMRSGESFWVYTKGGSDYQGPLSVEAGDGLLMLDSTGAITLRNVTDHPITPLLQHVSVDARPLPLSINVRVLGDAKESIKYVAAAKPATSWQQEMPPMEAGGRLAIPFTARQAEMTAFEQVSLLKISTDVGTELWVPVLGRRLDLRQK